MPKLKKTLKKKEAEDVAAPGSVEKKVPMVPAVRKLAHEKASERLNGCGDVAALALEEGTIQQLMSCGAGDKLVALLGDKSQSVRLAAVRALLNLVLNSEHPQGEAIAAKIGAQPMKQFFLAHLNRLDELAKNPPKPKKEKSKKPDALSEAGIEMQIEDERTSAGVEEDEAETAEVIGEIVVEFLQLVSGMSYFVEGVVDFFSKDAEALQALITCTTHHTVTTPTSTLAISAADLLLLICDENPTAHATLNNGVSPAHQQLLVAALDSSPTSANQVLAKVTIAGVLPQLVPATLPKVLQCLVACVSEVNPHLSYEATLQYTTDETAKTKKAALAQLVTEVKIAKTCFELFVNVVCGTEAANDEEDDEDAFKRTAVGDLLLGMKFGEVVGARAALLLGPSPSEATETALRNPVATPVEVIQEEFSDLESAVVVLLMNLVMVVPVASIGPPAVLWKSLQLVFARDAAVLNEVTATSATAVDKRDVEEKILSRLENLSSCLWTILRKGGAGVQVDVEFVGRLVEFVAQRRRNARAVKCDGFAVNVFRFVAEAVQQEEVQGSCSGAMEAVKAAGQLCMDSLRDSSLSLNVEAMNCIIDIFSDDQWDPVMVSLNMLHHLVIFAGFLSSKLEVLRQTNSIPEEVEPRLELVTENLGPFIEYKQSRLK